jgi:hypothetical protein
MRRASRKIRSADTRQFDLFAGPRVTSLEPSSFHTQLPEERHTSPYEAEVLDTMVSLLTRQWTCHLSSSDRAREQR